ncbi:MAG: MoaD/ThiS family protein [Planctomycetaceae bacterium]
MKVKLTLFAGARDKVGSDSVELQFPEASITVADVRKSLIDTCPVLEPLAPHLHFALGTEYIGNDYPVADGAELVCFPPVSGG